MPKRKQITLSDLQKLYKQLVKKDLPMAYKNNFAWLSKKVEQITKTSYINTTNINTTNNYYVIEKEEVDTEPPLKKVATKNIDEKVLTLPSLLNKTTSYEEWIKFKKLLATSSEEEKSEFFKKAKGEYAGRPFYYGLEKTAERLKEKEEEMVEVII